MPKKGYKQTEDHKRKISENHIGTLGRKLSEETKRKLSKILSGKNNPFYGKYHTLETKIKISQANKGRKLSEETKRKISLASQNNPNYGMGNKYHSEEAKKKMSKGKRGENHPNWGKHLSEKIRKSISQSNKGRISPMKNKHHTEEFKEKMSIRVKGENHPLYGKHHIERSKEKMSKSLKQCWQNPEYRVKTIKAILKAVYIKPNKPELQLQSLLSNLYPNDWQYVGNGQVILGGFCPDFININGKKQIIEMNGDYWHNRQGAAERDERKIKAYKQLGYKTLTVWEHELKNIKRLENRIQEFT